MSNTRPILINSSIGFYKKEAKKLLIQYKKQDVLAVELFNEFYPGHFNAMKAKLSDAQLVIARHYGQPSWTRMIEVVNSNRNLKLLLKAFDTRNKDSIEKLINENPILMERGLLKTAARYGDIRLLHLLYELGARDIQDALGQTIYSCDIEMANFLISKGGNMEGRDQYGLLGLSACELLNPTSLRFALEYHSKPIDSRVLYELLAMLIHTYWRNPQGKHKCIDMLVEYGLEVPDTPAMAFHRGKIDLLENFLKLDNDLLERQFSLAEIYDTPYFMEPTDGLHLTPVDGSTLLHLAIEYDEREIMMWLIQNGANVNAQSKFDDQGFGGHTPLFHTTVTFIKDDSSKASYLLKNGADPNRRCSIRKQLKYTGKRYMEEIREYKNVTPISYAEQWQVGKNKSIEALKLLKKFGGVA